jgi:hypothetical protein
MQFVKSFRAQSALHWLHCAGLIDLDNRSLAASGSLEEGLYILPVHEIENLLLVEEVFVALAATLSFSAEEVEIRLARLKAEVLDLARRDAERISLNRTSARIWEVSRSMGFKARNIAELTRLYAEMVARIDPDAIYRECKAEYEQLLTQSDYNAILRLYHNKGGLLNLLARGLDMRGVAELEAFVARILLQESSVALLDALKQILPKIDMKP